MNARDKIRKDALNKAFDTAFANTRRAGAANRRHPAEVTSDRLGQHSADYYDLMDGEERDALALVRHALQEIADGIRS